MATQLQANGSRSSIAVIGSGISGLGASWLLSRTNHVELFEATDRLGGHARTIKVKTGGKEVLVDTGFIVFNPINFPHLAQLFEHLEVPIQKSDMSFGVSVDGGAFEYGGRNIQAVFAQPSNAFRPGFWRMFRDIAVFNRIALDETEKDSKLTLGDLLDRGRFGSWFVHYYLLPMSGAIWSTPRTKMQDFPAVVLVKFFASHGLLSFTGQHQWWTVKGGSYNYVAKIAASMEAQVRLNSAVNAVTRKPDGVWVKTAGQEPKRFDHVVFACHADETLLILKDACEHERHILGRIPFRRNRIVVHTDSRLMPQRRACWSSWVYLAQTQPNEQSASVTYWLNSLQGIPRNTPLFATLNPSIPLNESDMLDEHFFDHPQYNFDTIDSQKALPTIQGKNNTWHCGAWTGMGFHEDGLTSAMRVAEQFGVSPPWS